MNYDEYENEKEKKNVKRKRESRKWQRNGGKK